MTEKLKSIKIDEIGVQNAISRKLNFSKKIPREPFGKTTYAID